MAFYASLGSVFGILVGFVLSILIRSLYMVGFSQEYAAMMADGPGIAIPFLGMGFGAVIGGVLGGVVGIRRKD